MSKAIYWQRGESLDYVNTGSTVIEANSIIDLNKHRIAVVGTSINPNEKGSIHVTGVYKIGADVYFDGTGITATAGSNTPAGYAAENSAAGESQILVKLLG